MHIQQFVHLRCSSDINIICKLNGTQVGRFLCFLQKGFPRPNSLQLVLILAPRPYSPKRELKTVILCLLQTNLVMITIIITIITIIIIIIIINTYTREWLQGAITRKRRQSRDGEGCRHWEGCGGVGSDQTGPAPVAPGPRVCR